MSSPLARLLQQAERHLQSGNFAAARSACDQALRKAPRHPDALMLSGVVLLALDQPADAIPLLERAVGIDPRHGPALEHLGLALLMCGRFAEAETPLREAARIRGAPASVAMRLGIALLEQERAQEALPYLQQAATALRDDADAQLNLGRAHASLGDDAQARTAFATAQRLAPHRPEAAHNLGLMALQAGDLGAAARSFEQALAAAPSFTDARVSLGLVQQRRGDHARALESMRQASGQDPGNAAALSNLAGALFQSGLLDDSAAAAARCIDLVPDDAAAYATLANVHAVRGALADAIDVLETGYRRTGAGTLLGMLTYQLRQACDWSRWQAAWSEMLPRLPAGESLGSPFWLLCEPLNEEALLDYTRRWARDRFGPPVARPAPTPMDPPGRRYRIGYLSSDLHEHATAYLIADVMERHDRERFEVYAYSYGPDDGSPMRTRMRAAFEHFVDIARMSDDAAAERIRADRLDLLVDLKGYTLGDRLGIMARRPCARQATWLGYPGTTGSDFIDFFIADPVVIPPAAEAGYTEHVVRMPVCYQPNDRARIVAEPLTREQYGLPADGFVFCCFNQSYKITPEVFAVWMRLLAQVPGSVLWLLESNPLAARNLAAAAAMHGMGRKRIVFAPRRPNAEHLARYRVANLALDTWPYTSHTTMSDALWCGCPAVGLSGDTFAARVSCSVLHAADLGFVVGTSLEAYEGLALRAALDQAFRERLLAEVRRCEASPLFDSVRFILELESLFGKLLRAPLEHAILAPRQR